jgi:hypothetical protein
MCAKWKSIPNTSASVEDALTLALPSMMRPENITIIASALASSDPLALKSSHGILYQRSRHGIPFLGTRNGRATAIKAGLQRDWEVLVWQRLAKHCSARAVMTSMIRTASNLDERPIQGYRVGAVVALENGSTTLRTTLHAGLGSTIEATPGTECPGCL